MPASARLGSFPNYQPCRYGTSRLVFRGPGRPLNGRHIAFVGGSETVGPSLLQAYPDLLEERLGEVCINFGQRNASIDAAMNDALIGNACRDAVLTVVSVTGALNMSNRFYSVHPRRNDRFTKPSAALQALYPEVDYSQICFTRHLVSKLHSVSPLRFSRVREELQAAWSARMRSFLERIGPDVVLSWFAPHLPQSNEQLASQDPLSMQEPLFVSKEMLAALRPLVRSLVVVPPGPASNSGEALGLTAHRLAADALAIPITEAIRARPTKRERRPPPADLGATNRLLTAVEDAVAADQPLASGSIPRLDGAGHLTSGMGLSPDARPAKRAPQVSIAILPFAVASLEEGVPAFADMLVEDITKAFHSQHDVEVRRPPAVTDQLITSDDIDRLRKGGLSHVLMGSIAVVGWETRLAAKLLDLGAGCFVWIRHFNRQRPQSLQAIADLGHEVAISVLSGLSEINGAVPHDVDASRPTTASTSPPRQEA